MAARITVMMALSDEKLSHQAVNYGQGNAAEHCGPAVKWKSGDCRHYQGFSACEIVRSPISPTGWCKRWEAA